MSLDNFGHGPSAFASCQSSSQSKLPTCQSDPIMLHHLRSRLQAMPQDIHCATIAGMLGVIPYGRSGRCHAGLHSAALKGRAVLLPRLPLPVKSGAFSATKS